MSAPSRPRTWSGTQIAVGDPGEGAGGGTYFWNKLRPEGRKTFFFLVPPLYTPLSITVLDTFVPLFGTV